MRVVGLLTALGWALVAAGLAPPTATAADDKVRTGPAPAWVSPIPVPSPTASPGGAYQILLIDQERRHAASGDEYYVEVAYKVLSTQGLKDLGAINRTWDPALETLTVNRAELVRDGKAIDLLTGASPFTVLRRESNLQDAQLDGRLTALMEVHDLRVGDVLHYAMTTARRHAVSAERPEAWYYLSHEGVAEHIRSRDLWPKSINMRWQATPGWGDAKLTERGGEMELVTDMTKVETPLAPRSAPMRFDTLGELELTAFSDWKQVSSLFAPIFAQAATLSPNSPLKAEAARIGRENATPAARASAALRLVEQQVRYLAVTENGAGLDPAKADETWTRRYGDCKAKTVLLVALLRELGIQAEPALTSSGQSDALPQRLPRVAAFDHVIVRVQIDNQTYWIDATRIGDRDIAKAPDLGFVWALPMRASGSDLERLPLRAFEHPQMELVMDVDMTAGLEARNPMTYTMLARGDAALAMEQQFSSETRQQMEMTFREAALGSQNWTFESIDYAYDEAAGETRVVVKGVWKQDWEAYAGRRQTVLQPAFKAEFKERAPGPSNDAPFLNVYPYFAVSRLRIRLPGKGEGYDLIGSDVDSRNQVYELHRASHLKDGVLEVEQSVRTLSPEVTYRDALGLKAFYEGLPSALPVVLRAPRGALAGASPPSTSSPTPPLKDRRQQAGDLLSQAQEAFEDKNRAKSLTLLFQAYALIPEEDRVPETILYVAREAKNYPLAIEKAADAASRPNAPASVHAMHARLLIHEKKYADALIAADKAITADPESSWGAWSRAVALFGTDKADQALSFEDGFLARLGGRRSDELKLVNLSDEIIDLPAGVKARAMAVISARKDSAVAFALQGQFAEENPKLALPKFDEALKLKPDFASVLISRARLQIHEENWTKALPDLDRVLRVKADSWQLFALRAQVYQKLDRNDEALLDLDEAVKLEANNPALLNQRCWVRVAANVELDKALRDCDASLMSSSRNPGALVTRSFAYYRLGRNDEAVRDAEAALKLQDSMARAIYVRGLARRAKGDKDGGETDLDAASKLDNTLESQFAKLGIKP